MHILSNWFIIHNLLFLWWKKTPSTWVCKYTCMCILTNSYAPCHTFSRACTCTITHKESCTHTCTCIHKHYALTTTCILIHAHTCKAHIYAFTHIQTYVHKYRYTYLSSAVHKLTTFTESAQQHCKLSITNCTLYIWRYWSSWK